MSELEFEGEVYNDDRMFVLYVCKCTVTMNDDNIQATTIYHQAAPDNCKWCVVTFRNNLRYRAFRVDHFDTEKEAVAYSTYVEAETPLISLDGRAPNPLLTYEEFVDWKNNKAFKEYDYKKMFSENTINPRETIYMQLANKD